MTSLENYYAFGQSKLNKLEVKSENESFKAQGNTRENFNFPQVKF